MSNRYLNGKARCSHGSKKRLLLVARMAIIAIGLTLEAIAGVMYCKTKNGSERISCDVPITYIEQIDPGIFGGVVRHSLHYDHPVTKEDMRHSTSAMDWKPGQMLHISVYANPEKAAINTLYGMCLAFVPILCILIAVPADRIFFKS